MGPKKDKAKAADPKGGGEGGDPGENPATLLTNYTKFCKQINITANAKLVKTFTDEEALEVVTKNPGLLSCNPRALRDSSADDVRRMAGLVDGVEKLLWWKNS